MFVKKLLDLQYRDQDETRVNIILHNLPGNHGLKRLMAKGRS